VSPALEGLLSRVEAATGPDRELDRDLAVAIGGYERVEMHPHFMRETTTNRVGWYGRMAPFYTSSIDAALALVERVLPGAQWEITNLYGAAKAELPLNHGDGSVQGAWREDGNVPLAILAATCRALLAKVSPQ